MEQEGLGLLAAEAAMAPNELLEGCYVTVGVEPC